MLLSGTAMNAALGEISKARHNPGIYLERAGKLSETEENHDR
jgi:hypothetical protein